jgi:hypothetical protein
MPKFRKKPIIIDADQVTVLLAHAAINWKALPVWIRDEYDKGNIVFGRDTISIHTLEGVMLADKNDWIIRGVKGELYPCKPDIFDATYEGFIRTI